MIRLGRRAVKVALLAAAIAIGGGLTGLPRLTSTPVAMAAEADGEGKGPPAEGESGAGHEGAEHAPEIHAKSMALQLLNFAVLLGILVVFGGKAVNKALGARHEQLKSELAAAATARAAAEESLRKQDERLKGLEQELTDLRVGIKKEAEVEKARLVAAAEERAKRLLEETTFVIEQQTKEGQAALRREAAEAGVRIAEQLLQKSFGASDQQRFLNGFVDDVAAEPAPAAAVGKAV